MFSSTFLKPRHLPAANIHAASSSPAHQSKMFARRAARRLQPEALFPVDAPQPLQSNSVEPLADEMIAAVQAIASADVVDVAPSLRHQQDFIQPADALPTVPVDSSEAIHVESAEPTSGMAPAIADVSPIEVAPTLVPVEEITATLPAMAATAEPVVPSAAGIVMIAPATLAVEPIEAAPGDMAEPTVQVPERARSKPRPLTRTMSPKQRLQLLKAEDSRTRSSLNRPVREHGSVRIRHRRMGVELSGGGSQVSEHHRAFQEPRIRCTCHSIRMIPRSHC